MAPERDSPPITADMRAAAREHPDSWLYVIDPAFDPDGEVPDWGVIGAYPVNAHGEIEEHFRPRPTYRPSPQARGWPEPVTPLERMVQLVRAGHREIADLADAVLAADLLIYADEAEPEPEPAEDAGEDTADETVATGNGKLAVIGFPDRATGEVVVPACTTLSRVPSEWPAWRTVRGSELASLLDGHSLAIDPGEPTGVLVPAALLTEASPGGDRPGLASGR